MWVYVNKKQFLTNLLKVSTGGLSFVGYAKINHSSNLKLPKIKQGILNSTHMFPIQNLDNAAISRLNLIYAKNQSTAMDLKIIFRNFVKLDQ